jgi:hypothetical protein
MRSRCSNANRDDPGPLARLVAEGAVSHVVKEYVVTPLGEEQVHPPLIICVARAHALPPSGVPDARLLGDIFEAQPSEVVIEMGRERRAIRLQPVTLDEEDLRQAVVVVVKDGDARARILHHCGLIEFARDDHGAEPGLRRNIPEIDRRSLHALGQRAHGLILGSR